MGQNRVICGCYNVICLLGQGGEGKVYLVRHLATEQLRAAKLLGSGLFGDRLHELSMMKHLHHPALPKVIDVLEDEEEIWLIMEYIKGTPLQSLERTHLSADQFFGISEQLAEVLVYLHTRASPILHLDIKPSNILIRPDGSLVLIDFGTSIEYQNGMEKQHYMGTKGFAAPEQQREGGCTDVRSDIYGYGAVLYYWLFGVPPGKRSEYHTAGVRIISFFSWKRTAEKVIDRCLKNLKEERFQDSRQLYRAVILQKRLYHIRKYFIKIGIAILFLGAVLLFSVRQITEEYQNSRQDASQKYEKLLEQTENLGFEQAVAYYKKAANMYPGDFKWAFQFMDRITEDYLFDTAEEEAWNTLIFGTLTAAEETAKELLGKKKAEYGYLAYCVGMAYWYYFDGSGGKYAAYKWFQEASDIISELADRPVWADVVQIHTKIGAYYEKLGRSGVDGTQEIPALTYWNDLTGLWELEWIKSEPIAVRCQIVGELLSCIIMRGYELVQAGVAESELYQIIDSVKTFCVQEMDPEADKKEYREWDAEGDVETILRQCEEAEAAIVRIQNTRE